jgi:hypothetical protein
LKPQVPRKFSSERVYRERKEENSSWQSSETYNIKCSIERVSRRLSSSRQDTGGKPGRYVAQKPRREDLMEEGRTVKLERWEAKKD